MSRNMYRAKKQYKITRIVPINATEIYSVLFDKIQDQLEEYCGAREDILQLKLS